MNLGLNLLDIILVLVLVGYLIAGLSRGFFRSLASLVGFVLGAVAAFWAGPWISSQVGSELRIPFVLVTVLGLLVLGQILGGIVGNYLARLTEKTGLGVLDRIGGGALNVAVAAIVLALLGSLVGQLGMPQLSQQVAGSSVLRTIEKYTPEPVREAMTETRDAVSGSQGIRQLDSLLFPVEDAPEPEQTSDSNAVETAGQSVVQVYGTADQCAQNQTGSGFVAASGLVVTNAHVVAGVDQPVVQTRDGRVYQAHAVQYDDASDLAVLYAPDLPEPPLSLSNSVERGQQVSFAGYPLGGPYTVRPATIQGEAFAPVQNVTTGDTLSRSIIQIAGRVEQGNSGGPLLDANGHVVGVIFAKAVEGEAGYAIPMEQVSNILEAAAGSTAPISTGECVIS
ncbi:MarP family serine protease [Kocuria atrinae]|uniref:MarP family serine protease n=1 Tax=Kocuria atrinae TaxID=592377 RepID=A0ABN2XUU9_9MICC